MAEIEGLTRELESQLGGMAVSLETLVNAENLFLALAEDMKEAVEGKQERFYYDNHLQRIKALSELMRYALKDLSGCYEKAQMVNEEIFHVAAGNSVAS